MKGYKNKLKDGEDKVLAQWIIQNAKWLGVDEKLASYISFLIAEFYFAEILK